MDLLSRRCGWALGGVVLAAGLAGPRAMAQDGGVGDAMEAVASEVAGVAESAGDLVDRMLGESWTDAELREIADMLVGSWKTQRPVSSAASDEIALTMHIVPVSVSGLEHTLYVEQARADQPWAPHFQAVAELYRFEDGVRLRTHVFQLKGGEQAGLRGLWLRPDLLPELDGDDLIATMDIDLERAGDGYAGSTPYPYPTKRDGAVQMVGAVSITADRFETSDRGIAADGSRAWGSAEGDRYVFERFEPAARYEARDSGLGIITYGQSLSSDPIGDGDRVSFAYSGYLASGFEFDSSRREGRQPMTYVLPGRLISGWQEGVSGMRLGEHRRLVIPPELGYGARGNPQARIGGTDTLLFDVEIVNVEETEFSGNMPTGDAPE